MAFFLEGVGGERGRGGRITTQLPVFSHVFSAGSHVNLFVVLVYERMIACMESHAQSFRSTYL